jgi:AraC-like DNA-binding protein
MGRVLPEFAILLISDGYGVFESKTSGVIDVQPRSLIFLLPGVWHRYRPLRETGWTERWICFNGELAHRLMDMGVLQSKSPVQRVTQVTALVRGFEELIAKVRVQPAGNSIFLSLYTLGLLGRVVECATGAKLPSALFSAERRDWNRDAITSRSLAWIWTRSHQAITVQQLAAAIGVKRRTLQRHFQEAVGHSIMEEIIRCRLNRAKRLLEETEMPMKAIAYLAGFSSQQRMRIAFTQRENVSPRVFRQRARRGRALTAP